jgi:aminocyclitol acetyltransferase
MKRSGYRLRSVLSNIEKERQIVLWGEGVDGPHNVSIDIENAGYTPSFFVMGKNYEYSYFRGYPVKNKNILDPQEHFVFIATEKIANQIESELVSLGFYEDKDFCSFHKVCETFTEDEIVNGVLIGKHSVLPLDALLPRLSSVGRFCSINTTAQINGDHQMNMITTNGRIFRAFSDEHKQIFMKLRKKDRDPNNTSRKVKIGNDVWIGANTFINSSKCSEIGDGAIVAAGAVVTENVPPYAIVAGIPAKIKKFRFTDEQINILLNVKWWDWDNETIKNNAELILYPESFFRKFRN